MDIPWTIISSIVGAFFGGGGSVLAYLRYSSDDRTRATSEWQDLYAEQQKRIDDLESSVHKLTESYQQSYRHEVHLVAAIEELVRRIDLLLEKLGQHQEITEEERREWTNIPLTEDMLNVLRSD